MDVLVNATTLVKGGGVQVATSFIVEAEAAAVADIRWHYVISEQVAEELRVFGCKPERVHVLDASPARSKPHKQQVLAIEDGISPDVVFTVFGPAFLKFRSPHLMGIGNGWITHSTWPAFRSLGFPARSTKAFLAAVYKGWWARFADRWVVEAENSRQGLIGRLGLSPDKIDVVPNSCASAFINAEVPDSTPPGPGEPLRLLYLSAWYGHKNIASIPAVAAAIREKAPGQAVKFVITVPDDEPGLAQLNADAERLGVSDCIENAGRVPLAEAVNLYASAHACFMPSLLETFSANYPEAMATGRPLICSDFDFSRAICQDAASYFDARSPEAAADAILGLVNDPQRWQQSVTRGRELVAALPTPVEKYQLYEQLIRKTIS